MELVFSLLIVGLIFFIYGLKLFRSFLSVREWLFTTIVINHSCVKEILEPDLYCHIKYYVPLVQYYYEVEGETYKSDRVCIDKRGCYFDRKLDADKVLEDIIESGKVYYDANNYSRSILTKKISKKRKSHYYAMIAISIIFFSLSFVAYITF